MSTRGDVYSLGLVLYELLCERRPFALDGHLPREVARVLSEEPAMRPNKARPGLGDDLEWILWKTLEKEPERRDSSASELAADIERSLRHEPVTAPPAVPPRRGVNARGLAVGDHQSSAPSAGASNSSVRISPTASRLSQST